MFYDPIFLLYFIVCFAGPSGFIGSDEKPGSKLITLDISVIAPLMGGDGFYELPSLFSPFLRNWIISTHFL